MMFGGRARPSMPTNTVTMQGFSKRRERDAPRGAGLVLLYAADFADLPPVFMLEGDELIVGREPPAGGFAIPQSAVSRAHARISRKDGTWRIVDLDSRNGTMVRGRFVREAVLAPFDEVRIGDAIFKFVPEGASAYDGYWIDGTVAPPGRRSTSTELVGGAQIDALMAEAETIAGTELTVLVQGETGTGKELVARALHEKSGRRGRFCAINCAAIPPALIESELFGYKRGAFTGADRDKVGLVKAANGGTLLLDEIGDMALDAQAKVLRMIESREVVPLGATEREPFDVRLVCATHRDLATLVESGGFRGDLLARIRGYAVRLPPLRERKEDIYRLVRHFLAKAGRPDEKLRFELMATLCRYDWPFNVRELEAAVRRAVAISAGAPIDAAHFPAEVRDVMRDYGRRASDPSIEAPSDRPHARSAAPPEAELRALLERTEGNVAEAARLLGKDRAQVHRWLRYASIDVSAYRKK